MKKTLLAALLLALPAGAQEYRTLAPGGDTICSDGSPYRFFVRQGDPGRLVVEFEGGGACWSDFTCSLEIYNRRITTDLEQARQAGMLRGIHDPDNRENPFRDWTHVYVPYCTGDLHWGSTTRPYSLGGQPFSVHHKGAANAGSALSWTFANMPDPRQVLVTGCSAGGYGATLWSAHVMQQYPGAAVAHLSDAAAGVATPGFLTQVLATWGAQQAWPSWIPELALDRLDPRRVVMTDVMTALAAYHPQYPFSQYTTLFDSTQIFFYGLIKGGLGGPGDAQEWNRMMLESLDELTARNPNFHSYTAPGTQHCIINRGELYTTQVNGVRFVDWIRALATTGAPGSVRAR